MRFFSNIRIFIFIPLFIIFNSQVHAAPLPYWSYDDDYNGQEDWGYTKGYEICESGANQSPITIGQTKTAILPKLEFYYKDIGGLLMITDKSFIFKIKEGGMLNYNNMSYALQTIELHSPSGHRIRNKFYPLEIHLIHKDVHGNTIIIAVFARIGEGNPALEQILTQAQEKNLKRFTVNNILSLISSEYSYYAYDGSLPYPPCTEGVKWKILKTPITISNDQLGKIVEYIGRNTRLPQPLYIREILETNQ